VCGTTAVSAGGEHTCALASVFAGDTVFCWGSNANGQLGLDGGFAEAQVPTPVSVFPYSPTEVAASDTFTCALLGNAPACWGDTPLGSFATPDFVPSLLSVSDLTVGAAHACVNDGTSRVLCWGDDTYGQVGGDGGTMLLPVYVQGLGDALQIAAGKTHTCAQVNGQVLCWGTFDATGSTPFDARTPTVVAGLAGVTALASGDGVTCAASPGNVTCFGKTTPSMQSYPLNAIDLCVGSGFGCAVVTTGDIVCWGDNTHGQLGNPDAGAQSQSPVPVLGLDGGAAKVSCGRAHVCAIGPGSALYCWGEGTHYKLGDGTTADRTVPGLTSN
jgi:alpha-tubulin suppressor-like RCC1 family protein